MSSKKLNEKAENEEFSRLTSANKCPNCGGKLDKGYFTAPRGMFWDAKKHRKSTMVADYVMPAMTSVFTLENFPAMKCEKCGVAIIDTRRIGRTPRSFLKGCAKCNKMIPIASEYCPKCGTKQPEYEA
jgi:RNA polymerase subunit RPABC4/transcription elongation factor Spt4